MSRANYASLDRPVTGAGARHCFRRYLVNFEHIVAVYDYSRQPIRGRLAADIGISSCTVESHLGCLQVILTDIDDRKIPYCSEIQSFVERASIASRPGTPLASAWPCPRSTFPSRAIQGSE